MEKATITLETGKKYTCGKKELDALKQAIRDEKPREIAIATIKLFLSSEDMVNEFAEKCIKIMDEIFQDKEI